jgi:hypothetical protein
MNDGFSSRGSSSRPLRSLRVLCGQRLVLSKIGHYRGVYDFDSGDNTLLRSIVPLNLPKSRPRRLARPRTSPFHGGNTGSNPVGDAKSFHQLTVSPHPLYRHKKDTNRVLNGNALIKEAVRRGECTVSTRHKLGQ